MAPVHHRSATLQFYYVFLWGIAEVPYKTFGRMLKDYLVFSIQAGPTPARIVVLRAVRFVPWK